jgi:hypothetical protein
LANRADLAESYRKDPVRRLPPMPNIPLEDPAKLRELAAWYRDYAERANTPWVGEGRLQTAEELERRAARLEGRHSLAVRTDVGAE